MWCTEKSAQRASLQNILQRLALDSAGELGIVYDKSATKGEREKCCFTKIARVQDKKKIKVAMRGYEHGLGGGSLFRWELECTLLRIF